jgi:hypothetical protein
MRLHMRNEGCQFGEIGNGRMNGMRKGKVAEQDRTKTELSRRVEIGRPIIYKNTLRRRLFNAGQ